MKKIKLLSAFFALAILISCEKDDQLTTQPNTFDISVAQHGDIIPGKYIVVLRENAVPQLAKKSSLTYDQRNAITLTASRQIVADVSGEELQAEVTYSNALVGFAGPLTDETVSKLKDDPRVLSVEPDRIVSLAKPSKSPGNGKGKGGKGGGGGGTTPTQPAQSKPWGISRVGGGTTTSSAKAWIIDSGIDLDHPDLNVDVANSATFLGSYTTADDQHGHGTHVAGTVAALNNTIGVVGVAPGTAVVAVRVLNAYGSGSLSGVLAGVDYVKQKAGSNDVANMSLGGGISTTLDNAVLSASGSCRFVLAAGNDADDANNHSPARQNGSNIYTVSAMASGDTWASFSNYGSPVDYIEPGVSVLSCYLNAGYATASGTSMAAPHLTGILLLKANPSVGGYVSVTPDLPDTDPIGTL